MQKTYLILLLLFAALGANAQQWGHATLIAPGASTTVSLLDTNSTVIKSWTGLSGSTGYSSYLTRGGDLWRTVRTSNNVFSGGGLCGRIQKVAWDGTILFDYTISDSDKISHHDICPMPNGNVLVIVYDKKTAAEVQAAGCTTNAARWTEVIYELHPTGTNTADIVWEWHLWDHLVQNVDANKANYQTSILDHPELLNINYKNTMNDWVHMNGIDYNPELDQVVVSSHFLDELWVIDHSTTTAEAASHSGGLAGKGGDFLYRWGNPGAYGATGTKVFNVVHDAHWVKEGPYTGHLVVFNNKGVSSNASAVDLINPPLNGYNYDYTAGQAYAPSTYTVRHAVSGYSSNMGNSQQLPNGNMLVCVATQGKVYEVTQNNVQLWSYTVSGSMAQSSRYDRCFIENPQLALSLADTVICAGGSTSAQLSVSATGTSNFTYQWFPALGLSSTTAQNPTISGITAPVTYGVTVTTPSGCTAQGLVTVGVSPAPVAHAGADVFISTSETATLTASGTGTYAWSNGSTDQSITVAPMATTTYTVTVTGSNGCADTDEVTVYVVDGSLQAAVSASSNVICNGQTVDLAVTAAGGNGNYTYTWASTPAGFQSNEPTVAVSPTANTTYAVTVSDGTNNVVSTLSITVHPAPTVDLGPNILTTQGNSVTFTASGGDSYAWSNGAQTASITVTPLDTTTYMVTVTTGFGCTATDEVTVFVQQAPLTVAIIPIPPICNGDVTQLFLVVLGGTGNYTYNWASEPVGFSSTLADPYINPAENTTYHVTVSDGNNTLVLSIPVEVLPLPDQPTITQNGSVLTASTGNAYQWFLYGTPIDNATGQSHTPTLDGAYQVQTIGSNGCLSPLSDPVEVIVSGTKALLDNRTWSLNPNPAKAEVWIQGQILNDEFTVAIYNSVGTCVLRSGQTQHLSLAGLPVGAYWVVLNQNGATGCKQLVIR